MFKVKTVSAATFILAGLLAGLSTANAATVSHPSEMMLAPQTLQAPGSFGATSGLGNQASFTSNIDNTSNINVQTNINNATTIDTSSNLSVTNTVNGTQVDYGMNGANVLDVIDNAGQFASQAADGERAMQQGALAQALEMQALRASVQGN